MALCCGTPSVLSQDVYDSVLALTSCSTETDGQPEVNNESFLRPFLNMHPALGIHVAFLIPWNTQELLKAHIPPRISFPSPFLPRLFGLSIACPNFIPCPICSDKCFCLYMLSTKAFGKATLVMGCSKLGETQASSCI